MLRWFILLILPCAYSQDLEFQNFHLEVQNEVGKTILEVSELDSAHTTTLSIQWPIADETPKTFKSQKINDQSIVSTHQLGITTLTRTILVSEEERLAFIHVRADQPGAVNFNVRFDSEAPSRIVDRRSLIVESDSYRAQAQVIPYESDVSDNGESVITLAGEGEALVILQFSSDVDSAISNPFHDLGKKFDPEHTPPNPRLIWEKIQERNAAQ